MLVVWGAESAEWKMMIEDAEWWTHVDEHMVGSRHAGFSEQHATGLVDDKSIYK